MSAWRCTGRVISPPAAGTARCRARRTRPAARTLCGPPAATRTGLAARLRRTIATVPVSDILPYCTSVKLVVAVASSSVMFLLGSCSIKTSVEKVSKCEASGPPKAYLSSFGTTTDAKRSCGHTGGPRGGGPGRGRNPQGVGRSEGGCRRVTRPALSAARCPTKCVITADAVDAVSVCVPRSVDRVMPQGPQAPDARGRTLPSTVGKGKRVCGEGMWGLPQRCGVPEGTGGDHPITSQPRVRIEGKGWLAAGRQSAVSS
eukprot:gene24868-biopygen13485